MGLNKTYKAFDLLDDITFLRFSLVLKKIKEGMRKELGLNYAHLLSNEKSDLVDIIGIPIDGSTNEIFRRFRQTKEDIVNEQLAVCKELHNFGANICINTVAHKGNLEDAQGLANLIKKMDYINKWQIFQYMPLGKFGLKNRECFEITDKQKENVL